jgi:predicted esterase
MKRFLTAALVALLASSAAAKDTAAEQAKLRAQIATEVAKVAAACAAAGAKTDAAALLAEAVAADPAAPGVEDAKGRVEALEADQDGAAPAAQKARAAAKSKVAPLYDKLGDLDHDPSADAQHLDWSIRAFQWDPKAFGPELLKKAKSSLESDTPWVGARLMAKLRKADPDGTKAGRYDAMEIELAKSNKLMLGSADYPIVAWVSLPKDWSKTKKVPVAVGVDGAGSGFAGYFAAMVSTRGSRTAICVAPVTLTNTNADNLNPGKYPMYDPKWLEVCKNDVQKRIDVEGPGVEAILDDLHERFGADEKCFHTGFSGGGIYTYWRLFQHPDKVRGAAPACANFGGLGLQGAPGAKDGGPAVFLMTGEKDPHRDFTHGDKNQPGIEPQTNLAEENLKKLGYTNVKRSMLPGVGHSALQAEFWKFVDEVLAGKFGK